MSLSLAFSLNITHLMYGVCACLYLYIIMPYPFYRRLSFPLGYCLSRSMTKLNALSSQEIFSKSVQNSMIVACTLMFCLKMKDEPKWQFIMNGITIKDIEGEESDIDELDNDEAREIEEEAEKERIKTDEELSEQRQATNELSSDNENERLEGRPATADANRSIAPEVEVLKEGELEKLDINELIEEAKEFFRNNRTQELKERRQYGECFTFKSAPL